MMDTKRRGFTIVELLVVIVVIAILAAIVIVSYNGIQQRARNAQIINGVSQFAKSLEIYKNFEGHYPRTSGEINGDNIAMTCLGVGYPDNYCGRVSGVEVYEDDAFNDELTRVVGNGAALSSTLSILEIERPLGSELNAGATYGIDVIGYRPPEYGTGEEHARTIQYVLSGHVDCGLSNAFVWYQSPDPQMTGCNIILEMMPDYPS